MEHRLGTCTSCEAHFRVPATFKADKAKCKKCGGVVEIGPVQGGEGGAKAVPAVRPPKDAPARKKPAAARPAAKPVAKPAPKAGTPRAGAGSKDSVRAAAEAAADRVRSAGTTGSAQPGAKKAAPAAAKAGGVKKAGAGARRSRRAPKPKPKKNLGVIVGAIVLLVAGGFGAMFFLKDGDAEAQAKETDVAALAPAAPEVAAEEPPVEEEPVPEEEDEAAGAEEEEEEPFEEPKKPAVKDPASVDLTLLEDREKLPETSDEEWAEIQQLVATFTDPAAGAAGNRARAKLLEKGRVAFPAILNAFKRVDVTTQDGYQTGDLIQRLLMDICRGNNFDWRYTTEPNDAYFNKRVIEMWFKSWAQVEENPKAWIQLGKLTEEEAAEYMAKFEDPADIGAAEDLEDF